MERVKYSKRKKSTRTGFLKLDFTAWAAILLMSLAGGVAAYLYHFKNGDPKPDPVAESTDASSVIYYTADIDKIIARCKTMVSEQNSFVIFEHGTCVRLVEPVSDHAKSASASLKILASPDVAFSIKPLNNNNYLVVFNDYLFCWLLAEDIAKLKEDILENVSLRENREDPKSIQELPEFEKRLGKFARLLMLEDAKNPVVKKIIRANLRSSTTPDQ